MVITTIISVYNTEWWYYHGTAINYCSKKFYNIGTRCQWNNILWAAFSHAIFCAAFMCFQFGFVIFWQKDFGKKMLIKCWWNWHQAHFEVILFGQRVLCYNERLLLAAPPLLALDCLKGLSGIEKCTPNCFLAFITPYCW